MKLRLVLVLSSTLLFCSLSSLSLNSQQERESRLWLTTALPALAAKGAKPEFGANVLADLRSVDAIKGDPEADALKVSVGLTLDKAGAKTYSVGSFLYVPANIEHTMGADVDTICIGTAMGP